MTSLAINEPLTKKTEKFWKYITSDVQGYGDTLAVVSQRRDIANSYNKNIRTIIRYLDELESKEFIETRTRKGAYGGTVIVFNPDFMNFDTTKRPILKDTLSPDDILDFAYPRQKKKEPKKKYRTKEQIAIARAKEKVRSEKVCMLNDMVEEKGYPTKEVWDLTSNPEIFYRGWLLSRMYNVMAVAYPEQRRNIAEKNQNQWALAYETIQRDRLTEYDCLDARFFGTAKYTSFVKLAIAIDTFKRDYGIDHLSYLTSVFRYREHLLDLGRKNVSLPYINTLFTRKTVDKVMDDFFYHRNHYREHPYYVLTENQSIMPRDHIGLPIMSMIVQEMDKPFHNPISSLKDLFDAEPDSEGTKLVKDYYSQTLQDIEMNEKMTTIEKDTLSNFLTVELGVKMKTNLPYSIQVSGTMDSIIKKINDTKPRNDENHRSYYQKLGNTELLPVASRYNLARHTHKGYKLDFSFTGARHFLPTLRAIKSSKSMDMDYDVLTSAIQKLGEEKIPLTKYGEFDMLALYLTHFTREELIEIRSQGRQQLSSQRELKKVYPEDFWWEVLEINPGECKRDGKRVILNNVNNRKGNTI